MRPSPRMFPSLCPRLKRDSLVHQLKCTCVFLQRSGCSSFVLFCFLPTTLLLLGGFGQHVWHYGVPMSVAQLTAQLELHWLEGFGLVPEPCSTDCR